VQNRLLPIAIGRPILERLARQTRWLQRKSRILTPAIFVQALVAAVSTGQRSLRELAIEIGLLTGETISKQSLSERINSNAVELLRRVTAETLKSVVGSTPEFAVGQIKRVGRILIGDSSILTLHRSLAEHFPGATNSTDKQSAQVRFQLTFDLLSGRWLQVSLDSYLRNDQEAALDVVQSILSKGDLIIRDLGYASTKCFRAIAEKGAFFLSRLHSAVRVLDVEGNALDLLKLARRNAPKPGDTFTTRVLVGAYDQFPCRLVIIRVPGEIGDQRRRRLKEEAKRKGRNYRSAYLELQNWMIFVTNLDEDQATDSQLHQLYQMRWRIENIFKLSKSQTGLLKAAGHRTNRHHAEVLIWAWLLMMISLSRQGVFRLVEPGPQGNEILTASIFKSIGKILQWIPLSIELAHAGDIPTLLERLREQQRYHDRYECRRRISLPQRLQMALGSHNELSS
jgi:hypothetical protein